MKIDEEETKMRFGRFVVFASAVLLFGVLAGCGGDKPDSSDLVKSATEAVQDAGDAVADAAAEATEELKKLSPDDLKAKVNEITEQIMGKEKELEGLQAKIKELSPSDMMSDGAKAMKEKAGTLETEIKSLKEKLTVYTDKMMGGE